jgi:hypothetical protein
MVAIVNIQNLLTAVSHSLSSQKILNEIDLIEYRRITCAEDLFYIDQLRKKAYRRTDIFQKQLNDQYDPFDHDPNVFLFGIYKEGDLIATIRIHHVHAQDRSALPLIHFTQFADSLLDQGFSFIAPTKLVIDPDLEDNSLNPAIFVLRLGFLAVMHFKSDFGLSLIRQGHEAFYRRVFQSTQVTPWEKMQTYNATCSLHSSPYGLADAICRRYPVFHSLEKERKMLFDAPAIGEPRVVSVKPTAKMAIRQLTMVGNSKTTDGTISASA